MTHESNQWYTNKDLFELINNMQGNVRDLRAEMKSTRAMIKQYNGLREEVGKTEEEIKKTRDKIYDVESEIETLKAKADGRFSVWEGIRKYGGWFVAIAALIYQILQ